MFSSGFYQNAPISIQNLYLSLRAAFRLNLRENESFDSFLKTIFVHDYSKKESNEYRINALRQSLALALESVPFYKNLGIDVAKIKYGNIEAALSLFPKINKTTLLNNHNQFLNPHLKGVRVWGATSGTTGTPLKVPQTLQSIVKENAFIWRQLYWSGFKKGQKRAWIRGDMIVPIKQHNPPFWRMNRIENMLVMSSFHLNYVNAPLYIKELELFRPKLIQAYPSSIIFLAKYLKQNNKFYEGGCNSIVTSSELLTQKNKDIIEERFGAKVFDWYGLFERNAAIGMCEKGSYHLIEDYSFIETEESESGITNLIGTAFNNPLFPLIRYETGDSIELLPGSKSCSCGRHYPIVKKINGRMGDYLIGDQGQRISILNHIVKGVKGIIETQFIQTSKRNIEINVIVGESFNSDEEYKLIRNTKLRVGSSMDVFVNPVTTIKRDKSGKFRQAINYLVDSSVIN